MRWPIRSGHMNSLVVGFENIIRSVLIVAVFALFAAPIITDIYYLNQMPSMADPANGRVHRMSLMHGYEIYVTAKEMQFNRMIGIGSFAGFVVVAGTGFWLQRRYFSEEQDRETQLRKGLKFKEEIERDRKA